MTSPSGTQTVDVTAPGGVVGDWAARSAELVVEDDAGGEVGGSTGVSDLVRSSRIGSRHKWAERRATDSLVTEAYAELSQRGEVEEFGLPAWKRLVSRR